MSYTRVWLFFAVVTCGTPPSTGKKLEPQDAQAFAISKQAIDAVNAAAGGELLGFGAARDAVIVEMNGPECGGYKGDWIEIAPSCDRFGPDALAVVLVHELGHAFGLKHSTDPHSVMWPTVEQSMKLDEAARSLVDTLVDGGLVILPPNAP